MLPAISRRPQIEPDGHFSDLPSILRRVYTRRDISNTKEIDHSLARLLPPDKLLNIQAGIELIYYCMREHRRILIIGDFDADGATSTALFMRVLRSYGMTDVSYLTPNRFEFGYGLTPEIVTVAAAYEPALIITVDNGISSVAGVAAARAKGINVLVTDHHLPGEVLPQANAIINPNQPHDEFSSKHLAGVGVVFYVISALRARLRACGWFQQQGITEPSLAQFLDIVAVGTVADVVKLDYNNRILVDQGLRRIRAGKCCAGITAILAVAGKNTSTVASSDLGFIIGPRLNAAGRLQDISLGIECLLTDDNTRAIELAKQLNDLNQARKHIEQDMQMQATHILKSDQYTAAQRHQFGISLYHPQWHQGVIGILAARIKEKLHRPTIIFARLNADELKGSARSITGLHIRDALALIATRHPGIINTFGGHAMAAGLCIRAQQYQNFADVFNQTIKELALPEQLQAVLFSDGELIDSELSLETAEILLHAAPWGQGFPEPVFDGIFTVNRYRIISQRHLKLNVTPVNGKRKIDAIAFNVDRYEWNENLPKVRIAYQLTINEYAGIQSPQLNVRYLAPVNA